MVTYLNLINKEKLSSVLSQISDSGIRQALKYLLRLCVSCAVLQVYLASSGRVVRKKRKNYT